jgi:hypothetical protein
LTVHGSCVRVFFEILLGHFAPAADTYMRGTAAIKSPRVRDGGIVIG